MVKIFVIDELMKLADEYAEEMSGPCPCERWCDAAREKLREAILATLHERQAGDQA